MEIIIIKIAQKMILQPIFSPFPIVSSNPSSLFLNNSPMINNTPSMIKMLPIVKCFYLQ